jgi:hypothetical protein
MEGARMVKEYGELELGDGLPQGKLRSLAMMENE